MSSLGSILSVARSALHYQQVVMQTAGHNIANAESDGYTRQRVEGAPNFPQRFPYGTVGTGVSVANVARLRVAILDAGYRTESAGYGAASLRQELLSGVERIYGEPSDDGLAASLDAFYSSWSDLAAAPSSAAARSVVQQRAQNVVRLFNGFDTRFTEMREQTQLQLLNTVQELNGLSKEIGQLNGRIVEFEVSGKTAGDLRDQRDLAIDRLSRLGDVRVLERLDGAVTVVMGNTTVVDGIHDTPLTTVAVPGTTRLAMATAARPGEQILPLGGTTEAMLQFLNVDLAESQERLDALANTFARSVNLIHQRGNDGTAAEPYLAFFVDRASGAAEPDPPADPLDPVPDPFTRPLAPGTITARTIALNAALEESSARIATTSSLLTRPSDNDVALAMASLRGATEVVLRGTKLADVTFTLPNYTTRTADDRTVVGPTSVADFYRITNSTLATQIQDAETSVTVRRTLVEQSEARREAANGVSIDEELTVLMRAQQAYSAAAKVIATADEMMDSLLNMV